MKGLVLLAMCLLPLAAAALEVPPLKGRVNDRASLLSPQAASLLEALLKAHEDSTANQVALLTIPSLGGENLEEFSMRVAEAWKLGQAKEDNGVLLLVARDDREMRIEVGGGLEGALPDITCGRIIRSEMVPRFREGDYEGGLLRGVGAVLAAIGGTYAPAAAGEVEEPEAPGSGWEHLGWLLLAGLALFFKLIHTTLFTPGLGGWLAYLILIPLWVVLGVAGGGVLGGGVGLGLAGLLVVGLGVLRLILSLTGLGRRLGRSSGRRGGLGPILWAGLSGGGGRISGGFSGGFSGGGGSFSGGGASGKW